MGFISVPLVFYAQEGPEMDTPLDTSGTTAGLTTPKGLTWTIWLYSLKPDVMVKQGNIPILSFRNCQKVYRLKYVAHSSLATQKATMLVCGLSLHS